MILLALAAGTLVVPAASALPSGSPANPTARAASVGAPAQSFPVEVRRIALRRGLDRPLPTTIWYPGGEGRFPLVLLSHGLYGLPEHFAGIAGHWASAGFVVAAPAYPHTNKHTRHFNRDDVSHQSADAAFVLDEVARLDSVPGDPFAGRLKTGRRAAAGHSAGGFTTAGLFTAGHDPRLRAGIVIAGGTRVTFGGPPAPMLYIHGDRDPTVTYAKGRAAYDRTPWPRAFLTLPGQRHGEYLGPGAPGYDQVLATTTDFLRWTLYEDEAARQRLRADTALEVKI